MNTDLAMNEIRIAEETLKKLDENKRSLLFALEVKNELKRITEIPVELPVSIYLGNMSNGGIGMNINGLFTQEELHDFVMTKAEAKAKDAFEALKTINAGQIETRPKEEPKAEQYECKNCANQSTEKCRSCTVLENNGVRVSKPTHFEEPETKPKEEPKKETPERTPRVFVDHNLVADMYFKKGMHVEQICEKTGYGLSSVYKHIQREQKARLQAEKERARR